jgi:hypothetical protein
MDEMITYRSVPISSSALPKSRKWLHVTPMDLKQRHLHIQRGQTKAGGTAAGDLIDPSRLNCLAIEISAYNGIRLLLLASH